MSVTLSNPHRGTDLEAGWAMGCSWGYVGPGHSVDPPLVIAPELMDAFNEGVLAGQQAAIEGLDTGISCVSLQQEVSSGAESFMTGVHVIEGLGLAKAAFIAKSLAHFTVEGLVATFLLLIPGPPLLDPVGEFSRIASEVQAQLQALNLISGALFLGAGIDESSEGCELLFVPLFKDLAQARAAVAELGRPQSVIVEWTAVMSGFRIVE